MSFYKALSPYNLPRQIIRLSQRYISRGISYKADRIVAGAFASLPTEIRSISTKQFVITGRQVPEKKGEYFPPLAVVSPRLEPSLLSRVAKAIPGEVWLRSTSSAEENAFTVKVFSSADLAAANKPPPKNTYLVGHVVNPVFPAYRQGKGLLTRAFRDRGILDAKVTFPSQGELETVGTACHVRFSSITAAIDWTGIKAGFTVGDKNETTKVEIHRMAKKLYKSLGLNCAKCWGTSTSCICDALASGRGPPRALFAKKKGAEERKTFLEGLLQEAEEQSVRRSGILTNFSTISVISSLNPSMGMLKHQTFGMS